MHEGPAILLLSTLQKNAGETPALQPYALGRVSPLIWVRCMTRRELASNGSRRCMVQRLSHKTRSPTRHSLCHSSSSRLAYNHSSSSKDSDSASDNPSM